MHKRGLLIVILLFLSLPVSAQDDHPLLTLLRFVPDDAAMLEGEPTVGFVDFRAIEAARPGTGTYATWEDWDADDSEARGLWIASTMRLMTGPVDMLQYLREGSTAREAVGFDFFTIDQAITFGQPPAVGNLFIGDFDAAAMDSALTGRGYEASEIGDATAWIHPTGDEMDFENRDPGVPFGGNFGLRQPVALSGNVLLNHGDPAAFDVMLSGDSLADNADYRAAADALTAGDGLLAQALFFTPVSIGAPVVDVLPLLLGNDDLPETAIEDLLNETGVNAFGTLPLYNLAVFADWHDGDEQVATIALVYSDADSAQTAAVEVATRLDALRLPFDADETVNAFYGGVTEFSAVAIDDRYVAVISVRYPAPSNEGGNSSGLGFQASGQIFRRWIDGIYRREFFVLAISE
jgi:hypothetical protein